MKHQTPEEIQQELDRVKNMELTSKDPNTLYFEYLKANEKIKGLENKLDNFSYSDTDNNAGYNEYRE